MKSNYEEMLEYLVSHGCEVHISRHIETNGFGFEIKPRKYYYKVSAKYSLDWYDVAGNTLESSLCSVVKIVEKLVARTAAYNKRVELLQLITQEKEDAHLKRVLAKQKKK